MPIRTSEIASRFSLKKTLDRFYSSYDFRGRLQHDPIEFPHRYSDPADIEVAAFIASSFAYGRIELFKPVIEGILEQGGRHPAKYFKQLSLRSDGDVFTRFSYRFNKGKDILCLMYMLGHALREWGSLKNLFRSYYRPEDDDTGRALSKFVHYLVNIDTTKIYGRNIRPYGLKQFFPSPDDGSTCKRLNLFLRWMIRTEDIDLGIWNDIPPSKLIIPLDTHIARISRCLGLTARKTSDWKTAKEITEALKRLDPVDPLKYDFALCHQGISKLCKGRGFGEVCAECSLILSVMSD